MAKLDSTIRKLIKNSLFLTKDESTRLLVLLEKMTEKEKKELFDLLQSEKQQIKLTVKNLIKIKGESAISDLNIFINAETGKLRKGKENTERKKEEETLDKLLKELDA